MKKRKLISGSDSVLVVTDSQRVLDILDHSAYLRHIIPDFSISPTITNGSIVSLLQGSPAYLPSGLGVNADFGNIGEGQLCYLIYHLLQREFLRRNHFVLHAAAIERGDPILLVGPSKSGKSTLNLEMVLSHNCFSYGDDAIKLELSGNEFYVLGGNTYVGISPHHSNDGRLKEDVRGSTSGYVDIGLMGKHSDQRRLLRNVIFLEPDLLGSNKSKHVPREIGKIRFYEAVCMELRTVGYCIMSQGLSLPSLDDGTYSTRLVASLKDSDLEFFSISGSFSQMVDDVERILDGRFI
ncbi:hypothetical protein J4426_00935 [Candidatus Woesearchaeota archaeon]|nr:hypothetical protein [Candidatus Woesearchaeota archaeon]